MTPPVTARDHARHTTRATSGVSGREGLVSEDDLAASGNSDEAGEETREAVSTPVPLTTVVLPAAEAPLACRASADVSEEVGDASSVNTSDVQLTAEKGSVCGPALSMPPVLPAGTSVTDGTQSRPAPAIDVAAAGASQPGAAFTGDIPAAGKNVQSDRAAAPPVEIEDAPLAPDNVAAAAADDVIRELQPIDSEQPARVGREVAALLRNGAASRPAVTKGGAAAARTDAQAMLASVIGQQAHAEPSTSDSVAPAAVHVRNDQVIASPRTSAPQGPSAGQVLIDGASVDGQALTIDATNTAGASREQGGPTDHAGQQQADTSRPPVAGREHGALAPAATPTPVFARYLESTPTLGAPLTPSAAAAWHVPEQIIRQMQLQWTDGTGRATLRLNPEHLGEVVVEMRVENGGVTATLRAETPAVRAWIESHRQDLATGLAVSGLRLDDLRVDTRDDAREGRREPQGEAPRRRSRQQPPPRNGMRFEVHA